ncbi:FtsW/RodA/SpoVE family cell cycle protein [Sphingomonas immobilis]|uniref:Probable peptidoglycan glycosyltransferase FtsW n=1 Tax=Sphingomonas immobilis TaxID=3063997 RepID=A0ABT8ZWR2_9SPHN|nr:putative peptidoglycan glycosyltransferase FtsW [Sphingomonas sp. CA1-15]MDO7842018.1 putative peptidoglycan glycosyltransferase FtsW [Sphingomonas sp. CA1-15]
MWFWDIDRVLLLLVLLLIGIGLVAVGSASPSAATRYSDERHHIPPLFYLWWQLGWVGVSIPVLLVVSMLPVSVARRLALLGMIVCVILLILVPFFGVEKNGARRWLNFGISLLQPSEFLKPFFVVTVAWLLALRAQDEALPVVLITGGLTALVGAMLMMQPDFGQTIVFVSVWFALLMISGTSTKVMLALVAAAPAGLVSAYFFYGTARNRINAFLFPDVEGEGAQDHFQTNAAYNTITNGGWRGTGPAGGTMKFRLPEGHTDYIFSVIGEEFGLIACMIIALLFLAIVVRVFVKLLDEQDEFRLFAAAGLATQFGVQALISMAVNTGLAPSKGMTLPFISYGGSSLIALSIGMGLLLALTRRNPFVLRSPYVAKWSGA